jgi:hypothetical protein
MKAKLTENKKFNLEKIKVAKLNTQHMKSILGGVPTSDVVTTTDAKTLDTALVVSAGC